MSIRLDAVLDEDVWRCHGVAVHVLAIPEGDVYVTHISSLIFPGTKGKTLVYTAGDVGIWIADAVGADVEVDNTPVVQVDRVRVVTVGLGANSVPSLLSDVESEREFVQDVTRQTGLVL